MKIRKNGQHEIEHPKPLIEVLSNTYEAIDSYAATQHIAFTDAALVLILNELRCIHWHYDNELAREEQHASRSNDH